MGGRDRLYEQQKSSTLAAQAVRGKTFRPVSLFWEAQQLVICGYDSSHSLRFP